MNPYYCIACPLAPSAGDSKLMSRDNDLSAINLLASFFVIPGARRDASFNVEFGSLLHIVAKNLGASRISDKVVPLRTLLPLASVVFVTVAGG